MPADAAWCLAADLEVFVRLCTAEQNAEQYRRRPNLRKLYRNNAVFRDAGRNVRAYPDDRTVRDAVRRRGFRSQSRAGLYDK